MSSKRQEQAQKCDDAVAKVEQERWESETTVMDAVNADRIKYEEAVELKRNQILWEIKELVWRLGYTQGYDHGSHTGHDTEIIADITKKKDEFEQLVQNTLQLMEDRVNKEREGGDTGNQNAMDELERDMEGLTQELEDAMPSLESVLEEAKKFMEAEI